MPMFEHLKVKPGQVIRSTWANELVDSIQMVAEYGVIDYYGYVHGDIIPDTDLLFNLGEEGARFKQVHAGKGYFSDDLRLQGKRVIKDEDPIHIASFYAYAATQIYNQIVKALLDADLPPKPILLGIKADYQAPDFADIFPSDLLIQKDGKIVTKLVSEYSVYTYVKWTPKDIGTPIIGLLNEGKQIEAKAWREFDFTVNKDDKVNVRISPASKVTIAVYNIPRR